MILDVEDVRSLIEGALKNQAKGFSEAQLIALAEIIDHKITEALGKHLEEYEHSEKPITQQEIEEDSR